MAVHSRTVPGRVVHFSRLSVSLSYFLMLLYTSDTDLLFIYASCFYIYTLVKRVIAKSAAARKDEEQMLVYPLP